jgi:hypothetical protein
MTDTQNGLGPNLHRAIRALVAFVTGYTLLKRL